MHFQFKGRKNMFRIKQATNKGPVIFLGFKVLTER